MNIIGGGGYLLRAHEGSLGFCLFVRRRGRGAGRVGWVAWPVIGTVRGKARAPANMQLELGMRFYSSAHFSGVGWGGKWAYII